VTAGRTRSGAAARMSAARCPAAPAHRAGTFPKTNSVKVISSSATRRVRFVRPRARDCDRAEGSDLAAADPGGGDTGSEHQGRPSRGRPGSSSCPCADSAGDGLTDSTDAAVRTCLRVRLRSPHRPRARVRPVPVRRVDYRPATSTVKLPWKPGNTWPVIRAIANGSRSMSVASRTTSAVQCSPAR